MFQLDDQFLADLGLADLPEAQKDAFLQHIYNELEMRVGTQLSEGLDDEQLAEFEAIIDRKDEVIAPWLAQNAPDYRTEEGFIRLQQALKAPADDVNLRAEYAATRWLEVNRPNYRDVVAGVLEQLKNEIAGNKNVLLDDSQAS